MQKKELRFWSLLATFNDLTPVEQLGGKTYLHKKDRKHTSS